MATIPYTVAADFHVRADAIDAMKHLIADVTRPSLIEQGCQIYHWSQGAEDPTLFLLYMEWQDRASFEAHVATPQVKEAERRLANEKMLVEPSREWHFVRLQTFRRVAALRRHEVKNGIHSEEKAAQNDSTRAAIPGKFNSERDAKPHPSGQCSGLKKAPPPRVSRT